MPEIAGMEDPDTGLRSILAVLLSIRGNAVGALLEASMNEASRHVIDRLEGMGTLMTGGAGLRLQPFPLQVLR